MRPEIREIVERLLPDADDAVLIDFETFYNDEVSVKVFGNYNYARHPLGDCYLLTAFARDVDYVGHPADFNWHSINGRPWLAHNAGFDKAQFEALQARGAVPENVKPGRWIDTADLAAFLGYPRALGKVAKHLFGIALNKTVRDETMKGRYWFQFSAEEKAAILSYAGDDAIAWCIWQQCRHEWPEVEQRLSAHTLLAASRGIGVDLVRIERDISTLKRMLWVQTEKIPWVDDVDEKGKPVKLQSPKALKKECERVGVPVPESTSLKNEAFLEWLDEYGEHVPAVRALVIYRRLKRSLAVYEAMVRRIRPDGRLDAGLKYYGADKTGRWAGGEGLNLQNLLKTPVYSDANYNWLDTAEGAAFVCDVRGCLVPGKGKKFFIPDLSQIEPRVLNWIVGNEEFLKLCAAGQSPYEASARSDGAWDRPESLKAAAKKDKKAAAIYALFKARVLALGYGAGFRKFIQMAFTYVGPEVFKQIFEAPVSFEQEAEFLKYLEWLAENSDSSGRRDLRVWNEELSREEKNIWVNSWLQVTDWREKNPLIASKDPANPGFWKQLDKQFKDAAKEGYYEIELPSGRKLRYFDVTSSYGWSARRTRGGKPERFYGGKLVENVVQAVARDVFAEAVLRLEAAGYPVVFHVHDEAIIEADEGARIDDVVALLKIVPEWAAGLPVDSEGEEATHYKK